MRVSLAEINAKNSPWSCLIQPNVDATQPRRGAYFSGAGAGMKENARAPNAIHLPCLFSAIQVT